MANTTVISSPGKVLAAGGYLVLDPAYSGVVISTSSRFYSVIQDQGGINRIRVRSPQFIDAVWNYSVELKDQSIKVEQIASSTGTNALKNKFVHLALLHTLSFAFLERNVSVEALAKGLDIVIAGDNDFYSQRAKLASMNLPRTMCSLLKIPPFCSQDVRLTDVHKTGLGSSAALITSLVTSLLLHLSVISREDFSEGESRGRTIAHNLAQFVHCLAQGKVGSGFDVSAAAFGSQLYTRFNPVHLQPFMEGDAFTARPLETLVSSTERALDHRVEPFQLPPMTRLMLADVDAGSDTPSLVGKVLKWRKAESVKADALWTALNKSNQALARTLLSLSAMYERDQISYTDGVEFISSLQHVQWLASPRIPPKQQEVVDTFHEVHRISEDIRAKMREMGDLSEVPIEPKEQTALLDVCASQAGVIGGGVPGAGGYDAIWLLVCDPPENRLGGQKPLERVEHIWSTYTSLDVSPLSSVESVAKGARIENLEDVLGLRDMMRTT